MNEDCLDPDALARLQRLGEGKFVAEMIDLFLGYAPGKVAAARTAVDAGDLRAVEMAVHALKSGAANLGAVVVRDLAEQMELLARQNKGETLPALQQELEAAFVQAKTRLQTVRQNYQP